MTVRFVKFNSVHVNPLRVLFVTDVYRLGEINLGSGQPIKTGLPTAEVIRLLEEAMNSEQPGQGAAGEG